MLLPRLLLLLLVSSCFPISRVAVAAVLAAAVAVRRILPFLTKCRTDNVETFVKLLHSAVDTRYNVLPLLCPILVSYFLSPCPFCQFLFPFHPFFLLSLFCGCPPLLPLPFPLPIPLLLCPFLSLLYVFLPAPPLVVSSYPVHRLLVVFFPINTITTLQSGHGHSEAFGVITRVVFPDVSLPHLAKVHAPDTIESSSSSPSASSDPSTSSSAGSGQQQQPLVPVGSGSGGTSAMDAEKAEVIQVLTVFGTTFLFQSKVEVKYVSFAGPNWSARLSCF